MSPSELRDKPRKTLRIVAAVLTVLWAALIFGLSHIQGSGYPDHPGFLNPVAHFCEYLIFAVLLTFTLHSPKRALWKSALAALIIASVYAVSDEFHQSFIPGRECDPVDWAVDTAGAAVGALGTIFYLSFKKVQRSRARDNQR